MGLILQLGQERIQRESRKNYMTPGRVGRPTMQEVGTYHGGSEKPIVMWENLIRRGETS